MKRGYIKVSRCCQDNALYFKEVFSKWQAWQDLIILANWEDGTYTKRGIEIKVGRGCLAWSELALSKRWKWSRQKVRTFLAYLQLNEQIRHEKNSLTTLIKIVNYEKYQSLDMKKDMRKTRERHEKDTSKEVKEVKEVKRIKDIVDFLNEKTGKTFRHTTASTVSAINARLSENWSVADFKKAISNQVAEWKGTEMEKYLTPDTLFRASKFEKYVNNNQTSGPQAGNEAGVPERLRGSV